MQVQPGKEVAISMGGNGSSTLIPDWAILDVISFGSNSSATLPFNFTSAVNLNNKFATENGSFTSNRTSGLRALLQPFDRTSSLSPLVRNPYSLSSDIAWANSATAIGTGSSWTGNQTTLIAQSIGNMTWSTESKWGSNSNNASTVRKTRTFPANSIVLPSEVTEIANVSDFVTINASTFLPQTRTNVWSGSTVQYFLKLNEFRLTPFFPGVTTRSNFFTIYAYAQALDKQGNIDSEALTKTLVEAEVIPPSTSSNGTTTPATYKVKKLYTQPIPLGQ
jgi:hypothetical protein